MELGSEFMWEEDGRGGYVAPLNAATYAAQRRRRQEWYGITLGGLKRVGPVFIDVVPSTSNAAVLVQRNYKMVGEHFVCWTDVKQARAGALPAGVGETLELIAVDDIPEAVTRYAREEDYLREVRARTPPRMSYYVGDAEYIKPGRISVLKPAPDFGFEQGAERGEEGRG